MNKERKFHLGGEGRKVIGKIISIKGHCTYGLKVGDEFEMDSQSAGGLCGYFYYSIYPYIMTYQFGGKFPDSGLGWGGDKIELVCPDAINQVRIQLRPEGADDTRHPVYLKEEEREKEKWRKKLCEDTETGKQK
jgi:uncharacterized repeat protein (TIGR04076 family)